tara:strand:+ start:216 stop:554 length:339 start_codon:yes stop_codon:yes gene_type:complete
MKQKLLNLIKSISNNNFRVIAGKGILITQSCINHTELEKHRDEIGTLCTKLGKVFNHNESQLEMKTEFEMIDGEYKPVEKQVYKLNRKGYEMRESIWIGNNTNTDDEALAVL